MKLKEIEEAVCEIEKRNFKNSLRDNVHIDELIDMYGQLINVKDKLFSIRIGKSNYVEYEDIRFRINESIINTKISLKEKLKLDYSKDNKDMKQLWNSNQ
jgi:hypothetical protein